MDHTLVSVPKRLTAQSGCQSLKLVPFVAIRYDGLARSRLSSFRLREMIKSTDDTSDTSLYAGGITRMRCSALGWFSVGGDRRPDLSVFSRHLDVAKRPMVSAKSRIQSDRFRVRWRNKGGPLLSQETQ